MIHGKTSQSDMKERLGTATGVDQALARACEGLLQYQHADGHFDGDVDQGTGATAQTIILEAYLGVLDPKDATAAVQWLWSRVQADGGFLAYPDATFSTMTETCCVYGALAVAGIPVDDRRRSLCRAWIEAHGGFAAADPITQSYLVMANVLAPTALPEARIEHVLIPGVEQHVVRTFMLFYGVTLAFIVPGLLHGLRGGRDRRTNRITVRAEQRIVDYLLDHQNPEGNWAGSQWVTSMALACLKALGVSVEHDAMVRGIESLRRLRRPSAAGLKVISLNADVWNTAMALRALHRAGAAKRARWAERAVDYLLSSQSAVAAPADWTNARPGAPRSGGWAFESDNPLSCDADTTSVVLLALADFGDDPRVERALGRGLAWLLSMQHAEGGFGAFSRPVRVAPPAPLFMRRPDPPKGPLALARFFAKPPYELAEIPSADLTSRVLCALSRVDRGANTIAIANAVQFLLSQQMKGGPWWGRWSTNYLAASAFVLTGLAAAESRASSVIESAVRWISDHQNADGGFGEVNESYEDPSLAGQGPSNAYVTGLVLQALSVCGHARGRAARRAARYLQDTQRADGLWEELQAVQSMAPPELFYKNFVNFQTTPTEGLAVYREGE